MNVCVCGVFRRWEKAEEHYSTLLAINPALTGVRVQRAQALTHMVSLNVIDSFPYWLQLYRVNTW